jgi:hypothetical protein
MIGFTSYRNAPRPPWGKTALIREQSGEESSGSSILVAQEGGMIRSLPDFSGSGGLLYARAATVSAQVSTLVRIASSE